MTDEMLCLVELEVLPDELYDPVDLLVSVHLVVLLLHDGRVARRLKANLD